MSAEYIAYINDQEYGPVSLPDLKDMWARGEIMDETQVRCSDMTVWGTWCELRNEEERRVLEAAATNRFAQAERKRSGLEIKRAKLRAETGYPALRGCLVAIIVIGVLGTVVSVIALFNDDARSLGITGLIACLSSIFSSFVTMVILDIADASLRQIE
jgi:hypothetical protein